MTKNRFFCFVGGVIIGVTAGITLHFILERKGYKCRSCQLLEANQKKAIRTQ